MLGGPILAVVMPACCLEAFLHRVSSRNEGSVIRCCPRVESVMLDPRVWHCRCREEKKDSMEDK